MAWDPKSRVGVVVLSNQLTGVGDIARHLLRPNLPLGKPTAFRHSEIPLDPALLDAHAGRYETRDEAFVIARERGFLTIQLPVDWGLPKLHLRPESLRDFFVAEPPVRIEFQTDDGGRVNGALVYPPRGKKALAASRISPGR